MTTLVGFGLGLTLGGCFGMLVMAVLVVGDDSRNPTPGAKPLFSESQRNEILKTANDALVKGIERRNELLAEMYPFTIEYCPESCVFKDKCYLDPEELPTDCPAIYHYREELKKLSVKVPE